MIYILVGIIGLLAIILVVMFIVLWQDKDYVYTREDLNKRTFSTRHECQDRINVVLKDYNDLKKERLEDNKKFMELTSLYATLLHDSFEFVSKYNIGDNIWYVKDSETYQGKIKTITTELFKSKDGIKATQYIYLLECGNNTKESEIICVH